MIKRVNKYGTWLKWKQWFIENGYKPWQFQYDCSKPEGFHVWFMKADNEDIEIITYNEKIYNEIFKYKLK